ncbi:sel1 repeat family protein [Rhizobium laguerreae]|nr:sel1 repeat family protein [Rhizobium laguerreae]
MAFVSTPRHLKDVAKDLQAALRKKHISKTIKDCVTLVEAMFAATNDVDMSSLSQFDDEIDALAVGKRIRVQANVLLSNGVPDGMSESIVNRIRPTKNRTKPPLTRLDAELSDKTLRLLDLAYEIGAEDVAEDIGKILFQTDISEIYDQMIALLERFRSTSPRALHHMAIATAVSRRKTSMSLDMLAEQLRQFPDDPQRHWVLVFSGDVRNGVYGGGKDVKAALNDYEAAAALGNKYAAFSAAQLYEDRDEEGDRERAIAMYERASSLGSTEAKTNKAILIASTGCASTQEKTEVVSLIETAAREGDEKAKDILVKATIDEMIRAGHRPALDIRHASAVPKVGDTRFYPDEASVSTAVERLIQAWNAQKLSPREDGWFQQAIAVTTEYKDWKTLISAVRQGKTAGRADECLNRGQLIKRRESQLDRLRAFLDIDWGVAQSIQDEAEPTRIKRGPLVLGDDYNLVYGLPPIRIDGSRDFRSDDGDIIGGAELPGNLGGGNFLRYSIDTDGDHVFEIVADGDVIASVAFYRSGYVDLSIQEGLRLDPISVPEAISAITIVALHLPDLDPDRHRVLVHLGDALALLSWHDILWMTAEGHPPVEKLSAELRGYSEDEGVEELCVSVMSSHGMKLLKNRSDEFGRSVERRMEFSGIDFYNWSAGTIFRQGDPADPDWWDPDGGNQSPSGNARSQKGGGSELDEDEDHPSTDPVLRTWLDDETDEWASMSGADMACFTTMPEYEVPDIMYFRRMRPGVDPDYAALTKRWGHPPEQGHEIREREPSTSRFTEEMVLVGRKKSGKISPCGIYSVSHTTYERRSHHEMEVHFLLTDHEDAIIGAVASLCMGIEDMRRAWENIFDEETRITIAVRLETVGEGAKDLLVQSLALREEAWREFEEDGEFPTELQIYSDGELVDHTAFD